MHRRGKKGKHKKMGSAVMTTMTTPFNKMGGRGKKRGGKRSRY